MMSSLPSFLVKDGNCKNKAVIKFHITDLSASSVLRTKFFFHSLVVVYRMCLVYTLEMKYVGFLKLLKLLFFLQHMHNKYIACI